MPGETPLSTNVLYCGFRIGERRFGVPVLLVKEVHAPTTITLGTQRTSEAFGEDARDLLAQRGDLLAAQRLAQRAEFEVEGERLLARPHLWAAVDVE